MYYLRIMYIYMYMLTLQLGTIKPLHIQMNFKPFMEFMYLDKIGMVIDKENPNWVVPGD